MNDYSVSFISEILAFLVLAFFDLLVAVLFFLSSPEEVLIDFREQGREGERERNTDVREKH